MEDAPHIFLAEMHFLRDLVARIAQRYSLPGPITVDLRRNVDGEGAPYRLTLALGEGKDLFGALTMTESLLARCRSDLDLQRELTSRIMSAIELGLLIAPRDEAASGPPFRARDPRFSLTVPVRITVQEAAGLPAPRRLEGVTANVSEGGVAVDLPERLEPWTPVSLRVEAGEETISLEALVVWAAEQTSAGPVRHGCIIVAVDPAQQEVWRRLLKNFGYQRLYKRGRPRFPLASPIRCFVDAVPPTLEGEAENVSETGLLIRLPLALAVGTRLTAALRLGDTLVERPARVIWVLGATAEDGRRIHRHGMEFTGDPLPRDVVLALYRLAHEARGEGVGGA